MRRSLFAILIGASALLVGCAPTIDDICETIEECEDSGDFPVDDCKTDGHAVEDRVAQSSCSRQYDAYLDCLDGAGCGWRGQCESIQSDLDACLGSFPE